MDAQASVTFAQIQNLLQIIEKKGVSETHFSHLKDRGILDAVFDHRCNFASLDRKMLLQSLGLVPGKTRDGACRVAIPTLDLATLLERAGLTGRHHKNICEVNFPAHPGDEIGERLATVFDSPECTDSGSVCAFLEHGAHYTAVTLRQLLAVAATMPRLGLDCSVVALRAWYKSPNGRHVAYLRNLGGLRYLDLYAWDTKWPANAVFPAVVN